MIDDKDIRELMDKDFDDVEKRLQNGEGGNPAVHGHALALLLKHVRILVRRQTVTEDDCQKRMANFTAQLGHRPTTCAAAVTTICKDLPPWLIIGGYMIARANGWIE